MYDAVALGELLIDFASADVGKNGNPCFEANPGGAVCNVLAMLARLGKKTAFIGKVGKDIFGAQLQSAIVKAGIDDIGLCTDEGFNTTLAFVKTRLDGDREFSFFRNNSADTQLNKDEIDFSIIKNAKLFHFGSLSLTHLPARQATIQAVKTAKENNAIISFDPNLRPLLWDTLQEAKQQIKWGISQCSILKMAKEELEFIVGQGEIKACATRLKSEYPNVKLLTVTCGSEGSWAFFEGEAVYEKAYKVNAIDTTGAGDTFFACCLDFVLSSEKSSFGKDALSMMLRKANAAAAIITTKTGALLSMPCQEEISVMMNINR